MATNAELTAQLAEMTARAAKAEKRAEKLTGELNRERDRANENAKARQEAEQETEKVRDELRGATASLKAYKGSATKAKSEATVLRKQLSPARRKIGAIKPPRTEEEAAARAGALEAAFAADTTELVFSDGAREIRELAPLTVTGDAWRQTPGGRALNHEPLLEPGDSARDEMTLRGFGLLNEAGEQVGWHALYEPVTLKPNQRVMLPHGSVRF